MNTSKKIVFEKLKINGLNPDDLGRVKGGGGEEPKEKPTIKQGCIPD